MAEIIKFSVSGIKGAPVFVRVPFNTREVIFKNPEYLSDIAVRINGIYVIDAPTSLLAWIAINDGIKKVDKYLPVKILQIKPNPYVELALTFEESAHIDLFAVT